MDPKLLEILLQIVSGLITGLLALNLIFVKKLFNAYADSEKQVIKLQKDVAVLKYAMGIKDDE